MQQYNICVVLVYLAAFVVHRHDVDEMRCSTPLRKKTSDTLIELCNFFLFPILFPYISYIHMHPSGECVFLFYGPGVLCEEGGPFVRSSFILLKKVEEKRRWEDDEKETIWMR